MTSDSLPTCQNILWSQQIAPVLKVLNGSLDVNFIYCKEFLTKLSLIKFLSILRFFLRILDF